MKICTIYVKKCLEQQEKLPNALYKLNTEGSS